MNRILFEQKEVTPFLPASDFRARHLVKQLHVHPGDTVRVGIIDGKKGIARIVGMHTNGIHLDYHWEEDPLPLLPLIAVIAHPRPPSLHRLARDLCGMGIREMRFFISDTSPKSYQQSHVWKPSLLRKSLVEGASQAGETRISGCALFLSLEEALQGVSASLVSFHVAAPPLRIQEDAAELCYIIGPERKWSSAEEAVLASRNVQRAGLGPRILRTETASTAAAVLLSSALSARVQG